MDTIAVLDFGSQLTHLLANRIRRLGVYTEILEPETPAEELRKYKALVLSGGPASVNAPGAPTADPKLLELGLPILGVCYGHQWILKMLGGTVAKGQIGEYGLTPFEVLKNDALLKHLPLGPTTVYASHFDTVTALPEGFEAVGRTADDPVAATQNLARNIYTLQFHPEVTHSVLGLDMLKGFLDLAGVKREWSMQTFLKQAEEEIRAQVQDRNVFMLVSGGVDSTVAFALLERALGPDRVYALCVDTGFMRKNEAKNMQEFLKDAGIPGLHVEDASDEFFTALAGAVEPEQKRKIIGDTFLRVQARVAQKLNLDPDHWLLGQGTIYPDTIESGGTKHADKIKTHHNRVPEIQALIEAGKIIEPVKELYKDEVRAVGRELGLAPEFVERHPFPGPGLAVRCLCAEGPVGESIEFDYSLLGDFSAKAHLLPLKSVGVQGDERTYRQPILLDGNGRFPGWPALTVGSVALTNAEKRSNRVLWLFALKNGESVKTVDILKTTLTRDRIATLQEADDLVNHALKDLDPKNEVWQFPVVLVPVDLNQTGEEAIILRPISSENGMTANFTALDPAKLQKLAADILKIPGISSVLFDLTNKPPATIEWE